MQFEINKKTGGLLSLVAVIAFALGALLMSQSSDDHHGMHMDHDSGMMSNFGSSEVHFAQMMIPHHQQAILMSDIALKNSSNKAILDLATRIKAEQAPEIQQMTGWLLAAGVDPNATHTMAMDGMLTDSEITELQNTTGAKFDRLFLEGMIKHHEGALSMLHMIKNSSNSEAKKLATDIERVQKQEIAEMKNYLNQD